MTRADWLRLLRSGNGVGVDYLVYADWLEEQDTPADLRQAELIRCGVGAQSILYNKSPLKRQNELLLDVESTWPALGAPAVSLLLDVADVSGAWRRNDRAYYGRQELTTPPFDVRARAGLPRPELARRFLNEGIADWPRRRPLNWWTAQGMPPVEAWEYSFPETPCGWVCWGMVRQVLCSLGWWLSHGEALCARSVVARVVCWDALPHQESGSDGLAEQLEQGWFFPPRLPRSVSAYLHMMLERHGRSLDSPLYYKDDMPLVEVGRHSLSHAGALNLLSDALIWWALPEEVRDVP